MVQAARRGRARSAEFKLRVTAALAAAADVEIWTPMTVRCHSARRAGAPLRGRRRASRAARRFTTRSSINIGNYLPWHGATTTSRDAIGAS